MLLKRPLFYISMSFVIGMYILSVMSFETAVIVSVCAGVAFLIMFIRKFSVKNTVTLLLCALMFFLGCVRYELSNDIKAKELYTHVDNLTKISGEVIEPTAITEKTVSFIAKVTSVDEDGYVVICDEKVRFSHFIQEGTLIEELNIPKLGNTFSVIGQITVPNGAMNTGGFDYSRYLKGDNIFFQCEIFLEDLEITGYEERVVPHIWANFRQRCISFYDAAFPGDEGAVLKAFVLGDKSSLTTEIENSFSASGLAHILAVSGLHVSVFTAAIAGLLRLLKTSKRKQMLTSAIAGVFFVLFTGASVSAIRAGVMSVMALVAKLVYRKADPISVLAEVAAIFCLINPHIIFDASFMLSFAATVGILILNDTIDNLFNPVYKRFNSSKFIHRKIVEIIKLIPVGISAQVFVIPILVYLFNGFSVMSVIATLVVTPLLQPLLVGGLVFCAASFIDNTLAAPVGGFIYFLAKMMIALSEFFGGFTFSKVVFGSITPFLLLLYAVIIAVFVFAVRKEKLRCLAALISTTCLLIIYLINYVTTYDTAQVSFINVGQGDCALIKAPGNCDILVDAGGYAQSDSAGEFIIAPYLTKNGVTDIEYVVLSHLHSDHVVGLVGLIDIMEIKHIIMPYNSIDTEEAEIVVRKAKELGIPITCFVHGDTLKINDDMKITAITPDVKQYIISKDMNDRGLMVRLDYGESSFIFTGDITSTIEKYTITYYSDMLDADVLKVAHHGSYESSCQGFVDAVSPDYAYIPVGNNSYGHPHDEVIDRLESIGCEVYRADVHRDVTFYFDKDVIHGVKYTPLQ